MIRVNVGQASMLAPIAFSPLSLFKAHCRAVFISFIIRPQFDHGCFVVGVGHVHIKANHITFGVARMADKTAMRAID